MTDKRPADEQEKDKQHHNSSEQADQHETGSELTPWQKENLKYLNETGEKQKWLEKPDLEKVEKLSFSKKNLTEDIADDEITEKIISLDTSEKTKKVEEDKEGRPLDLPKSLSYADKLPKIKEERRKRLIKRLSFLLGIFTIGTAGLIYYISPYSKLNGLEITGNKVINKQEIANATQLKKNQFIWDAYFNNPTKDNVLSKLPRIKSVKKEIKDINQIKLTVSEYQDVAYAKKEGKYFPILDSGTILDENIEPTNEKFTIFTNFKNDSQFKKMFEMYQSLDKNIKNNINEIILNPDGNIQSRVFLRMKDGNQVVGSTKDLAKKIGYYDKIAEKMDEKGIIDMEAGIYSYSYETKEAQDLQKLSEKAAKKSDGESEQSLDSEKTTDGENLEDAGSTAADATDEQGDTIEDPSDSEVIDELKNNE